MISENLNTVIRFNVSTEQAARYRAAAEAEGKKLAKWCRDALDKVDSKQRQRARASVED